MKLLARYVLLFITIMAWPFNAPAQTTGDQTTDDQTEQRRLANALNFRRDLAFRLEDPLLAGKDVSAVLALYMKGRAMGRTQPVEQIKLYLQAMAMIRQTQLKPLPKASWPKNPENVPLELKESFTLPDSLWQDMQAPVVTTITFRIIEYRVDNLKLYAVMTETTDQDRDRPLVIFAHGAAYGVPEYMLPWMAQLAQAGYTVAAPAFRGEPMLSRSFAQLPDVPKYTCEGAIENLTGEVNDLLGLATGLREKGLVKKGKYAVIGHSFGSGAGLLATARTEDIACAISYDAWMTDPFLFYWERLANEGSVESKSYLWGSWEDFAKQPATDQLKGLMARSIVHHAERVNTPLLLFTGGGYNGSAYHYGHKTFVNNLRKAGKTVRYEIMPGGGHNFFLYTTVEPALSARALQMKWLGKYFPAKAKP